MGLLRGILGVKTMAHVGLTELHKYSGGILFQGCAL